ncbi:hypothetical protein [Ilumatobacter sp.]|uniref:hypothetical protein n=1 Tax=Ilumatobacter sp. TaxID=1967498 RepID=UPI003B5174D1
MTSLSSSTPAARFAIHLNDHRALVDGELALAMRSRSSNLGTELGHDLTVHVGELSTDRDLIDELLDAVGGRIDPLKSAGARLAEKFGRLKTNGQLTGSSPLSPVVELEGLVAGCHARSTLWSSLGVSGVVGGDLHDRIVERGVAVGAQLDVLRAHLQEAVSAAFDGLRGVG